MQSVTLDGRERVLTLAERGRSLLECHRRDRGERHQEFRAGISRPRELTHDASLYRAYLRAEERLREQGAEVQRVVLENDLKHLSPAALDAAIRLLEPRSVRVSFGDMFETATDPQTKSSR